MSPVLGGIIYFNPRLIFYLYKWIKFLESFNAVFFQGFLLLPRDQLNDHVEGFITPADEKRARVAIHPTAPNRGCCFIVKRGIIPSMPGIQ